MTDSEPNGTITWRVNTLERRVDRLYDMEPSVVARQVTDLHEDIAELRAEVRGVRRALWATALSVTGGAIVFAFTAFQVFGA